MRQREGNGVVGNKKERTGKAENRIEGREGKNVREKYEERRGVEWGRDGNSPFGFRTRFKPLIAPFPIISILWTV